MGLILEKISPRYDVWLDPAEEPQLELSEAASGVMSRSLDFALLIASPLILLADWLRAGKRAPGEPPEWESLGQIGQHKVWSQTLMDSDQFPTDLDLYDQPEEVYLLFRFRFAPALPELEAHYFFEEILSTEAGLWLLSYNPPGEGMTLWFLDHADHEPEAVARVASQEWELEGHPGGALRLEPLEGDHPESVMVAPTGFIGQ